LVLRRQLGLFEERGVKPRRIDSFVGLPWQTPRDPLEPPPACAHTPGIRI